MYSASATFLTKIKDNVRGFNWGGTINTSTPITLNDDNILSGELVRSISGEKLEIGSVYSSQLTLEIDIAGVSRYELYNCTVSLEVSLDGALDVIPMGTFIITEVLQSASKITITAFDNMILFDDVAFQPAVYNGVQKPYDWLSDMCSACGVTLGMTSAQVRLLPNGKRNTGFSDVVTDVKTWRDVLGYLGAYLGSFAYIGRDGKLYLETYKAVSDDTIPASFRFTSNLSDFRTTYDGLSAIYKWDGLQEYVSNTNTGGIVLDLGVNPFLQFTNQRLRLDALQEIIDVFDGLYYVPYEADLPLIPIYDPADVLTFIDKQAGAYDLGAITEITYTIGGTMSVKCSGDNPRLADAQDRFSKTVEGLSKEYSNGQEIGEKSFWLLSTTNTNTLSVGSTEVQIAEIEYDQKTYGQNLEMILTLDAQLSASATVNIRVVVDDDNSLEMSITEDKTFSGERVFHCTNPQKVYGTGIHACKVYMTVTDSAICVGDLY